MKYIQDLGTVKDRVYFIYSNNKDSVQSDIILLSYYEKIFSNIKFGEGIIKRMGRYWREDKIQFPREEFKHFQDLETERKIKASVR